MCINDDEIREWHNAETGQPLGGVILSGAEILKRYMPSILKAEFDIDFARDSIDKDIDNSKVKKLLGI